MILPSAIPVLFLRRLTPRSSLGVPIGNAVLIAALHTYVPVLAPGVSTDAVVIAGPLDLKSLTPSEVILHGLREAWARAVSRVNILLVVVVCVSVPTACGMEWLNIKKISREREEKKEIGKQNEGTIEANKGPEVESGKAHNEKEEISDVSAAP